MKVTANMTVSDILEKYPGIENTLEQFGLSCLGCPGSTVETLAEAAEGHNLDLEELLAAMNNFLEQQ